MTIPTKLTPTQTQIAREKAHRRICDAYLALSNQFPDETPNRLFTEITIMEKQLPANTYKITTVVGVTKVLQRYGLYTPGK